MIDLGAVGAALAGLRHRPQSLRSLLGGTHALRGSGRAPSFAGFRPFLCHDERRSIDARASARMGEPVVRIFEREAVGVLELVLDISPSMHVGHELGGSKLLQAATLLVALGALAGAEQQQVGLSVIGGPAARLLPARAHPQQAQRLARALSHAATSGDGPAHWRRAQPIAQPLAALVSSVSRRSQVVLFCDGLADAPALEAALGALTHSGRRVLWVQPLHPIERTWTTAWPNEPDAQVRLVELEGEGELEVDAAMMREALGPALAAWLERCAQTARRARADHVVIDGGQSLRSQLMQVLVGAPPAAA